MVTSLNKERRIMINYLNIYDQLQTIDIAKSKILFWHNAGLTLSIILILAILIPLIIKTIIPNIDITHPDKLLWLDREEKTAIVGSIIMITIILLWLTIPAIQKKNKLLSIKNIDIAKMYANNELGTHSALNDLNTDIDENQILNLLSSDGIQNVLAVNGASNVDTFKENVSYLKDLYDQKKKTLNMLYNKETTISEDDYVNSILNQFYLGKISNTPADMTDFEEDYPRVSSNLKK